MHDSQEIAATESAEVGLRRWMIPAVLHVSLFIAFLDRINLSVALPMVGKDYGWSDREIAGKGSLLLGAFYIAYAASNLFLSGWAARLGPRRSLLGLVVAFSLFTALGGPLSFSLPLFVTTRVLLGIGEGVHFPMMNALMKQWFPPNERSRANAIWVFGATLATILAPVLLVPVITTFGWKAMLVGCGVLGMVVTVPLLYLFAHDTPRQSPFVSAAEAAYIEAHLVGEGDGVSDWSFLRRPVFWLAVLGAILNNYCVYGILNWLPTYFVVERHIEFDQLRYAASLPYLAGFAGFVLYAILGDYTNRRIVISAAGFLGASVSVYLVTLAPSVPWTILAFSMATLFQTAYISQEYAILQRVLPSSVIGSAAGLYNGCSILFGAVGGTVLLGWIVGQTGSYSAGLYSVVAATALGAAVLCLMARYVRY